MIMRFHLLTSFFYNFIGADYAITAEVIEYFELEQYYFFTNFSTKEYLCDIQMQLRFSLKMEYWYTDLLLPLDFEYFKVQSNKLEKQKKEDLEEIAKRNNK